MNANANAIQARHYMGEAMNNLALFADALQYIDPDYDIDRLVLIEHICEDINHMYLTAIGKVSRDDTKDYHKKPYDEEEYWEEIRRG